MIFIFYCPQATVTVTLCDSGEITIAVDPP